VRIGSGLRLAQAAKGQAAISSAGTLSSTIW
jgi:hypothetical protein